MTTDIESTFSEQEKSIPTHSWVPVNSESGISGYVFLRFAGCYCFWLLIILALYWPVLPALPYLDQPVLMLNHQLADNDWDWFWSMLSYARNRKLGAGDYFAFRPLHMAIIAIEDIFFRYRLIAQGVINCCQFAFAATLFSAFARRYVGSFAAAVLTFLWVPQLAGSSIVFWQHITPYILCPALFLASLLLLEKEGSIITVRLMRICAGLCIFAACLTHEIGVMTACAVIGSMLLYRILNHSFPMHPPVLLFLLPVIVTLLLNAIDYFFLNPPPSLMGPADALSHQTTVLNLVSFLGAIGTAFIASPVVHLAHLGDGYPVWDFLKEPGLILLGMAFITATFLLYAVIEIFRVFKNNGYNNLTLALTLFLSFFASTFFVCAFRMYSRNVFYMTQATYYYSLFAISLSVMITCVLAKLRQKRVLILATTIFLVAGIFHTLALQEYFHNTKSVRQQMYSMISSVRAYFKKNTDVCFSGTIPIPMSNAPLFHDFSCSNRPETEPIYLLSAQSEEIRLFSGDYIHQSSPLIPLMFSQPIKLPNNSNWLISSEEFTYGHDISFSVNRAIKLLIVLHSSGIDNGVIIQHNTVRLLSSSDLNMLDFDSGKSEITYTIRFTDVGILFFANGGYIAEFPYNQPDNNRLNLVLHTSDNKPLEIRNAVISSTPSNGKFVLKLRDIIVSQETAGV